MNDFNPTIFKNVLNEDVKFIAINTNDDYTLLYYIMWYCSLHNGKKIIVLDAKSEIDKLSNLFNSICTKNNIDLIFHDRNFCCEYIIRTNKVEFNYITENSLLGMSPDIIVLPSNLNTIKNKQDFLNSVASQAKIEDSQIIFRTTFNNNDTIDWDYICQALSPCKKEENSRQYYNNLILKVLQYSSVLNSDIRFWQMLFNLGIIKSTGYSIEGSIIEDDYYIESETIYKNIIQNYKNAQLKCKQILPNSLYVNENDEFVLCTGIQDELVDDLQRHISHYTADGYTGLDKNIFQVTNINNNDSYLVNSSGQEIVAIGIELITKNNNNKNIILGTD